MHKSAIDRGVRAVAPLKNALLTEAVRVYLHGKWQLSRGRNPSLSLFNADEAFLSEHHLKLAQKTHPKNIQFLRNQIAYIWDALESTAEQRETYRRRSEELNQAQIELLAHLSQGGELTEEQCFTLYEDEPGSEQDREMYLAAPEYEAQAQELLKDLEWAERMDHSYYVKRYERAAKASFIDNPRKAFESAKNTLENFECRAGGLISRHIHEMVVIANATGLTITSKLNDVLLPVKPGTSPDAAVQEWERMLEENRKTYLASDEYKEYQRRRLRELEEKNNRFFKQVAYDLDALDHSNPREVVRWLSEFTEYADDIGFLDSGDNRTIMRMLPEHFARFGYEPGVNTGKDFDGNSADNTARYLIGQALDCIKRGMPPHPVMISMSQDYEKKFFSTTKA